MSTKKKLLGELEQKIMLILWESSEPLKPVQVKDKLNSQHAYTTVMTVLKRLTDKNLLKRKLKSKAYFYSPKKDKKIFVENRLGGFFDEMIGDFGNLAISQFVDCVGKDQKSLKLLRKYLKNAKKP